MNEVDNQIISISTDCEIKVWDMRSSRCLETIVENTGWEPSRVTIHYDPVRQVLFIFRFRLISILIKGLRTLSRVEYGN